MCTNCTSAHSHQHTSASKLTRSNGQQDCFFPCIAASWVNPLEWWQLIIWLPLNSKNNIFLFSVKCGSADKFINDSLKTNRLMLPHYIQTKETYVFQLISHLFNKFSSNASEFHFQLNFDQNGHLFRNSWLLLSKYALNLSIVESKWYTLRVYENTSIIAVFFRVELSHELLPKITLS